MKKEENISVKSDSIIPDAKDILEISKQKWKSVTPDELLSKIKLEASNGERKASFFESYISEELVKELHDKGYKVKVSPPTPEMGPCFFIYW